MTRGEDIVAAARSWVGVPWHHQGRSRHGVDCVGLIEMTVAETVGLPVGYCTPRNYARLATDDVLVRHLDRWASRSDPPVAGTIVAFRFGSDLARHVGICAGETIIHALNTSRRVVEQRYGEPWLRRTLGAWVVPGVLYE